MCTEGWDWEGLCRRRSKKNRPDFQLQNEIEKKTKLKRGMRKEV
jgi:hypothetical protein